VNIVSRNVDEGGDAHGDDVVVVSVATDGEVSVFRPVSREFIEAEMERWSGLLERLGNVGDDV
jgi:hypothetical protein